ncbi:hypothetical protein [Lichenifustis flavocetrariae]|uniref:Uncharacterized protein n=1 Tax=Lichenifustis flavocetrariae TaxID=2949735 RepID=A0AA42CIK4_9HYPH|nr:hypothetical protein [Lichenifustis flavocetrariae]MCW6506976.1 hypothetical protein [Lichenifustis flavocetrariae]
MPKPTKQTPLDIAKAEIVTLTKRGAALEARRDYAVDALAKATTARRKLLVDHDEPDAAALAEADRMVREATDAEGAARDALREIDDRVAQLRADVNRMQDAEARATQALQLEAAAAAVDAVVARMRHAAALIGQAQADLAVIIGEANVTTAYAPPTEDPDRSWVSYLGIRWYGPGNDREYTDPLSPSDVADRIAGHIVASALPSCAVTTHKELTDPHMSGTPYRSLMPLADPAAVSALLAEPIRAAAGKIKQAA